MTPGFDPKILETFARYSAALIVTAIAFFLLWLVTIIDIVSSEFKNNTDKIIWFFFVILLAPVGMPLYFFIGRHQKSEGSKDYESSAKFRDRGRE